MTNFMGSTKKRSLPRILNFSVAVAIISLLSSLPYLHEILTHSDGSMQSWVPNLGIQDFLADENGKILKYSDYRYFLFTFFFNVFILFGWLGWYRLKTFKLYRKAILLPLISIAYQIVIILSSARASWFNQPEVKVIGTLVIGMFLAYLYFPKKNNRITKKLALIWVLFFFVSLLPYFHDILTFRTEDLRSFVPNLGIEQFLTRNELVLGWNNYRVFIFIFTTHIFAQIGWAGWFFDARNRLFRPFLLVPVIFNLYELTIVAIDVKATAFNKPDWKLYTAIILAILIAVNLYFNSDKALQWMERKSNNLNKKNLSN